MPKRYPDRVSQRGKFWVLWADFDWVAARILYLKKNPKLWMPAGLLAHKVLEQYLKALMRSYGDKTEWRSAKGHNLCELVVDCAAYEPYFSCEEGKRYQHRLSIFYDIYRAWEYPQELRGWKISGEVATMGDDHLTELDETVAAIRPRIRLAQLGLPPTFGEVHGSLAEGPAFVEWAKDQNHTFNRMEVESRRRNPMPTLEQIRQAQLSTDVPEPR